MKRNFDRLLLQRELLDLWTLETERFHEEQHAIGNAIPVGGAHMDYHFRASGLHGILLGLRQGLGVIAALNAGKAEASHAVKIWNARREWQVHRAVDCTDHYLETTLWRCLESVEIPF